MKKEIEKAWQYIADWLHQKAKHYDSNVLSKGASPESLKQLEQTLAWQLPPDLYDSFSMHNGFEERIGLCYGGDFLSIAEIENEYKRLTAQYSSEWRSQWMPLVFFNDYAFWCINLVDATVLDVLIDYENGQFHIEKLPFKSFTALLASLAKDLEEGNGCMGELLCE